MADPDLNAGDRGFANLLEIALEFYLRHKTNIDDSLDTLVVAAIMELVENLPAILALNKPGPQ